MLKITHQFQHFEFYPKAFESQRRKHGKDPDIFSTRMRFIKLALTNFFILQCLFLCLFAYLFGSLYQLNDRVHALKVAFVDYDGGLIGTAVRNAYSNLQGKGFPSLLEKTPAEYANEQSLRSAVCHTKYWAAIFISSGASSAWEDALAGGAAAASYNKSNVISYVWNEARYWTVADGNLQSGLVTLSDTAKAGLLPLYGKSGTVNINTGDANVLSILSSPWTLESIDIQPTTQGSRLIYNTLLIVLILIADFFFLGYLNGLYAQFNIYARLYPLRIVIFRTLISLGYTLVGSLCTTSMLYAFRAGWELSGVKFVLCWMVLWLFAHINFLALDVFTVWLSPPYVPMALITWVIFNVTSVLLPFDVSNGFYRWAFAIPAHEAFATLIDIWSGGCYPSLRYSLPVLFVLEVVCFTLSTLGVYRRAHYAVLAEERKEKEFQGRIDAALAVERKREQAIRAEGPVSEAIEEKDKAEVRQELEEAERMETEKEAEEERISPPLPCDPICFPIFDTERGQTTLIQKAKTLN